MKIPTDMIEGSIHNTSHGNIVILSYNSSAKIKVRFLSTGFETTSSASMIRVGEIKDKLKPTICGVGFIGDGEFRSRVNKIKTKEYIHWKAMITRCYSGKDLHYADCSVCSEWHNFQNFAAWYHKNKSEGAEKYHLDKDIKVKGNKEYSPEACMLVTAKENILYSTAKKYRAINPCGDVFVFKNLKKFSEENSLIYGNMNAVANGRAKTHKGWVVEKIGEECFK